MSDPNLALLRRLFLWTALCSVSAAPSFVWAMSEYDRVAMLFGVAFFILLYTAVTSTEFVERFKTRPFVRRTLYIGYSVRLGLSIIFPLGLTVDLFPGTLSVRVVESLLSEPKSFVGTLATTVVQGAFLNCILGMFMLIVYFAQRLLLPLPIAEGFCKQCGYDLRASPIRCPECGEPVPDAHADPKRIHGERVA